VTLADFAGDWVFSHPSHAGRQTLGATAAVEGAQLVVRVPRFGTGLTLRVVLVGDRLEGAYRLGGTQDAISLDVKNDGHRLAGAPAGFTNRERWLLSRA